MMGQRMGADFSGVRFHTGAEAAAKADAMGARAYTSGADVYFGEGGFDPAVAAHELVHTVQQGVVDSGVSTMATPMGGVQMKPDFLKAISRPFKAIGRPFKYAGTAAKEFIGGKKHWLDPSEEERAAAREKAEHGDYSRWARMNKDEAQAIVDQKQGELTATLQNGGQLPGTDVRQGATQVLDPAYRNALSQMSRDENLTNAQRQDIQDKMERMDKEMMVNTMRTPTAAQEQNLREHYKNRVDQKRLVDEYNISNSGKTYLGTEGNGTLKGAEEFRDRTFAEYQGAPREEGQANEMAQNDLEHAKNSGDVLLRTMLLMQLGDFQRTDSEVVDGKKQTTRRAWDQTMANAFSHGGRTGFLFGANDENGMGTEAVANALFGANMGEAAGVHSRAAATHHIKTPKMNRDRNFDMGEYKEGGGIFHGQLGSIWGNFKNHIGHLTRKKAYQNYGMDMAIGGVGNAGTAGEDGQAQMINADGRSGHMYIGMKSSNKKRMGGLLMGLESDSPYRMNQTGHMHNAAAIAEEGSSTGGLKTDIQGDKYGGRTVDLSNLKNEELQNILNGFTQHFQGLRGGNAEQQAQYEQLLQQMAGERMSVDALQNLLVSFMGDTEETRRLVTRARRM